MKERFINYVRANLTEQQLEVVEANGWDAFVSYNKKTKLYGFSMNINISLTEDDIEKYLKQ